MGTTRFVICLMCVALFLTGSFAKAVLRATRVSASEGQVECGGAVGHVATATSPDWHSTDIDFAQDLGQDPMAPGVFHAVPLVRTLVPVREKGCVAAHFSAMAMPVDNSVVFQVRLDGKPMRGHLSSWNGVQTPAVATPDFRDELIGAGIPGFDPSLQSTPAALPRMVAYNFFARVESGLHSVEVYFAGCCGGSGPHPGSHAASAGSPTLIVYYN